MVSKKLIDITPPKLFADSRKGAGAFYKKLGRLSLPKKKKKKKRRSRPKTEKIGFREMAFIVSLAVFVCAIGIVIWLSVLGIKIEVYPVLAKQDIKEDIVVDATLGPSEFSEKTIPGKLLEEEGEVSQYFDSSGSVFKEVKAKGTIRVYNNYHLPQVLVATTRFLSSDEKLFRLKDKAHIPARAFADVEVQADKPGPDYNVEPSTFSIPGLVGSPRYTYVYGKSSSAMEGGSVGEVAEVSKADLEVAESALKEKLIKQLKDKLSKQSSDSGLLLLPESLTQEAFDSSSLAQPGTESKNFNFEVKMGLKAIAVKKQDLENFAKSLVLQEIGEDKSILQDTLKTNYNLKALDLETGQADLELSVSAVTHATINLLSLKKTLLGKSIGEGSRILENDERFAKVRVTVWPFWRRRLPDRMERLELNIILAQ